MISRDIIYPAIAATMLLMVSHSARADDLGKWQAMSSSAMAVTGDITISPDKIGIAKAEFPLSLAREIDASHLADVGALVSSPHPLAARLYRTRIEAKTRLLHLNTMCGSRDAPVDATWVLVVDGKNPWLNKPDVTLAFYSGTDQPTLGVPGRELCGTFGYTR